MTGFGSHQAGAQAAGLLCREQDMKQYVAAFTGDSNTPIMSSCHQVASIGPGHMCQAYAGPTAVSMLCMLSWSERAPLSPAGGSACPQ